MENSYFLLGQRVGGIPLPEIAIDEINRVTRRIRAIGQGSSLSHEDAERWIERMQDCACTGYRMAREEFE